MKKILLIPVIIFSLLSYGQRITNEARRYDIIAKDSLKMQFGGVVGNVTTDSLLAVRSSDSIVRKIHPNQITGSGGTYTASNGLTMTANNTKLGGVLTENTIISNTGGFGFSVLDNADDAILKLRMDGAGLFTIGNHLSTNRITNHEGRMEIKHPDSILFNQDNGYYRFDVVLSTIDTTTYKPFVIDINGKVRRGNSWSQFTGAGGGGGATDLSYTASPTNGIVTSSTGTDATIPIVNTTNAGLMPPSLFDTLSKTSTINIVSGPAGFYQIGRVRNDTTMDLKALKFTVNGGAAITPTVTDSTAYFDITAAGGGTVTNVATGLGLSGGPITTTGTIIADTSYLVNKSTAQVISGAKNFTGATRALIVTSNDLSLVGLSVDSAPDSMLTIEGGVVNKTFIPLSSAYTAVDSLIGGEYTPTLTNNPAGYNSNVSASSHVTAYYHKIGNIISFGGTITATATSGSTNSAVAISLPFASNLVAGDITGGAEWNITVGVNYQDFDAAINTDATNDRLVVGFVSHTSTSLHNISYWGWYQVK